MPTILTKRSNTPGAIPATADLTNAAGGAELAVNTADKRLFTINSSSAVVELGTNPGSLTCADASFTLVKAASASITNLTATSLVLSNLSIASANVTTLTSASATITNLLATTLTVSGLGVFPLGASATPSIVFSGDTNTGIYSPTADNVGISTGGSERLRIDSSGNAGLGGTPRSWGNTWRSYDVYGNGAFASSTAGNTSVVVSNGAYNDNTNWKYIYTGIGAALYTQNQNAHEWRYAPSGTAGNTITFTQAMTLDASGNLGVGTSSPSGKLNISDGDVRLTQTVGGDAAGVNSYSLYFKTPSGDVAQLYATTEGSGGPNGFGASLKFFTKADNGSLTQRAVITSVGNLLVNGAASGNGLVASKNSVYCFASETTTANTSDVYYQNFISSTGTQNGYIYRPTSTGTTQLVSASDQRLKENIADATFNGIGVINAVKVREFDWKETGHHSVGFIAQELHEVCSDAVAVGEDDENGEIKRPWAVSREALVPYLVKAIQEQQAMIKALEAKVAALEAK